MSQANKVIFDMEEMTSRIGELELWRYNRKWLSRLKLWYSLAFFP